MIELTGKVGFASSVSDRTFAKRRRAGVGLFATLALAISLVIAATAVSIGVARAGAAFASFSLNRSVHSALRPASLMIGHHFSVSAL